MTRILIISFCSLAMLLTSCAKPVQTIQALKDAATSEANACVKYAAFAKHASDVNLPKIATMFRATAAAKDIQMKNYITELETLGETFQPEPKPFASESIFTDFASAIQKEQAKPDTMYRRLITITHAQGDRQAEQALTWAMETDLKHVQLYAAAAQALLTDGDESSIAGTWYVCAKCSATYNGPTKIDKCKSCHTKSDKIITFTE